MQIDKKVEETDAEMGSQRVHAAELKNPSETLLKSAEAYCHNLLLLNSSHTPEHSSAQSYTLESQKNCISYLIRARAKIDRPILATLAKVSTHLTTAQTNAASPHRCSASMFLK